MGNVFIKKFEVRWSDLDPNRHLANSAYMNFMSHSRMDYLTQHGFGHKEMMQLNIGPVIFHEHLHYFKEVFPGKPVYVTIELKGLSKNGMFFEFEQSVYNGEGEQHLYSELMGAFIDLSTRKLTTLPDNLIEKVFSEIQKTDDFKWLEKSDTRKHAKFPKQRPELFQ